MSEKSKMDRVIEGKARFREKVFKILPQGMGGKDRLPPGQHLVTGFPVLDLGVRPRFVPEDWRFYVEGDVENPLELTWDQFTNLPKETQVSDFHCVTTWSKYDVTWGGVKFRTIVDMVKPKSGSTHLIQGCGDGYTTNLPLDELKADDILLAYELEGQPLPLEHGGPLRMIVPHLYAWKSSKFLNKFIFQDHDTPGFWEVRGYHNRGCPWKEERFSQ